MGTTSLTARWLYGHATSHDAISLKATKDTVGGWAVGIFCIFSGLMQQSGETPSTGSGQA